jgi:hypothetical protein
VFTAGAYYGVQAIRAGSTQVRSVTVTDGIAGGPAWATSYSGIFASSSDDYALEALQPSQWWSGIAPSREEDPSQYYNRRSEEISTRRIYCKQLDGGNLPYSLPISIWSMQCLATEGPVAQMPFSAEVTLDGNGVTVDIDNKSPFAIRGAWIAIGDRAGPLGGVPAKSKTSLRADALSARIPYGRLSPSNSIYEGPSAPDGAIMSAIDSQGTQQRTRTIEAYLQRQAAVVYAVYEDAPCCCQVADAKKTTNHIQLVRLVVMPKKGD